MSKKKSSDKQIVFSVTFDKFPALMKHKSGSIFLITKFGLQYTAICLAKGLKEEGLYGIGYVLKTKQLTDFERMPAGFFIELICE